MDGQTGSTTLTGFRTSEPGISQLFYSQTYCATVKSFGLGLKFRPTLKPPSVAQFLPQIQDFCRSVRLHKKFEHQPDDPDFNPRLYVKSEWDPPREDPHLEDNLYHIRQKLCQNLSSSKPKWNANLNSNIRAELKNLKENKAVRVTDTDKNLGPAVVSADWMKTETLKHFKWPGVLR